MTMSSDLRCAPLFMWRRIAGGGAGGADTRSGDPRFQGTGRGEACGQTHAQSEAYVRYTWSLVLVVSSTRRQTLSVSPLGSTTRAGVGVAVGPQSGRLTSVVVVVGHARGPVGLGARDHHFKTSSLLPQNRSTLTTIGPL